MTPEVLQALAMTGVGTLGAITMGAVTWAARRVVSKVDAMDLVVRGDGNGNPGLGEKIRRVHYSVTTLSTRLGAHMKDSQHWQDRIVKQEVRCDLLHGDEEV